MDRKKIILIAVSINAVLLVLLFMTALPQEEENRLDLAHNYVLENKPFLLEQVEPNPSPVLQQQQIQVEKEVVHQLPPLLPPPDLIPSLSIPQQKLVQQLNPSQNIAEVIVKKGDSLEKIAKAHKTTIDEILRTNQLTSTFLRVGQVLKVPVAKPKAESAVTKDIDYYIVKVGDTPWTIAQKHHMKVDELLKLNNLNSEKARRLKPGDRLKVK